MLRKRFYIKKRCYRWPLESAFKSAFVGSFIINIKNSYHHFSIVLHDIIKTLNQSSASVSIYEQIFFTINDYHFSIRILYVFLFQDYRGSFRTSSSGPLPPLASAERTTTTACHRRTARWNHKVCCIRNHNNIQYKVTQLSSRYFNF